jgi:hypothetical protein
MAKGRKTPSDLHNRMIALLQANPDGLTEGELREKLEIPTRDMAQFGRRRRELYNWFRIDSGRRGTDFVYRYVGERDVPRDAEPISQSLRAKILWRDRSRCRMCGRTPQEDDIKLHIDHKIPREWGGKTEEENLWSLCDECNAGKKNHFATHDADLMRRVMNDKSVHVRLGELLKAFDGEEVTSDLMDFVANRDDWPKRTRELRYLGWKIRVIKRKNERGRVKAWYRLDEWKPWPENPTQFIQEYERERARRNKAKSGDQ